MAKKDNTNETWGHLAASANLSQTVQVRIDDETHRRIERLIVSAGIDGVRVSRSKVLRTALDEYLDRMEQENLS